MDFEQQIITPKVDCDIQKENVLKCFIVGSHPSRGKQVQKHYIKAFVSVYNDKADKCCTFTLSAELKMPNRDNILESKILECNKK